MWLHKRHIFSFIGTRTVFFYEFSKKKEFPATNALPVMRSFGKLPFYFCQSGGMADTPDLKSVDGLYRREGSTPSSGTNESPSGDFKWIFLCWKGLAEGDVSLRGLY